MSRYNLNKEKVKRVVYLTKEADGLMRKALKKSSFNSITRFLSHLEELGLKLYLEDSRRFD